jgi:hypothetical protein
MLCGKSLRANMRDLLQRHLEYRRDLRRGKNQSITDAILWLLWIPSSLILIVMLIDSILS